MRYLSCGAFSPARGQWLVTIVLMTLLGACLSLSITGPDDHQDWTLDQDIDETPANTYVNMLKRYYRGWGHQSRFPWKRLPDRICFRQPCKGNKECCYRWNICDKSAKVCVDCWYGSTCKTESDCCSKYPYCARVWRKSRYSRRRYIAGGKCVSKL